MICASKTDQHRLKTVIDRLQHLSSRLNTTEKRVDDQSAGFDDTWLDKWLISESGFHEQLALVNQTDHERMGWKVVWEDE